MLRPFGWEVLVRYEKAVGVWFSFVASEVGDQFGIPFYGTLGFLFGDEVVFRGGFARVKRTNDTGNDIEIHGISC